MSEKEEKEEKREIIKREISGVERRPAKDTYEQSGVERRITEREKKKEK